MPGCARGICAVTLQVAVPRVVAFLCDVVVAFLCDLVGAFLCDVVVAFLCDIVFDIIFALLVTLSPLYRAPGKPPRRDVRASCRTRSTR